MMSQKELQKYAEQDYKLVDPEYIKQLEQDSEKLIKFKKYSVLAAFIAVIVIAVIHCSYCYCSDPPTFTGTIDELAKLM